MELVNIANQEIDQCESTNDLVKKMGKDLSFPHGTWLASRVQTLGKGSKGRDWVSPEGNIHLSVLIRDIPRKYFLVLPIIAGLEVCRELEKNSERIGLKWPNDLVVLEGTEVRKLGGILCEGEFNQEHSFVVIGVGLNCLASPRVDGRSTICLQELAGNSFDRQKVRENIYKNLVATLTHLEDDQVSKLLAEYQSRLIFKSGDEISWIDQKEQTHFGQFVGLSEMGQLIVQTDGAQIRLLNEEIRIKA